MLQTIGEIKEVMQENMPRYSILDGDGQRWSPRKANRLGITIRPGTPNFVRRAGAKGYAVHSGPAPHWTPYPDN